MKKEKVKIGELNFELSAQEEGEGPMLEVENDASIVYLKMNKEDALRLRELLDHFLCYSLR